MLIPETPMDDRTPDPQHQAKPNSRNCIALFFALLPAIFGVQSIVAQDIVSFDPNNPNYYQLVLEQETWDDAVQICEDRGGNLATITSEDEWQAILAQMEDSMKGLNIWLGGRRISKEDSNWIWVTEEPWGAPRSTYHRWRRNEPDGHFGEQDRLFINGSHPTEGPELRWNDHPNHFNEPAFSKYIVNGYLAEFGWAKMSGTVAYEGTKSGPVRITLRGGPDDQPGGTISMDSPGEFTFPKVVKGWEYTLVAYIDEDENGFKARTEPSGKFIYSPHLLTADVTDIELQIFDFNNPPNDITLSSFNIPEEAPIHTTIGRVTAMDPDEGSNPIVYVVKPKNKFIVKGNKLLTTTTFLQADDPNPTITLRAVDEGGLTFDKSFILKVITGNQPPTVSSLESQTIDEDAHLDLVNAITLSDDAGSNDKLDLTLSVPVGTIHFHDTRGLEFIDGENGSSLMTIRGTLSQLKGRVGRLVYNPPGDYNGELGITLFIDDKGNPGGDEQNALVDLYTIPISITAINDAPSFELPEKAQSIDENGFILFSTFLGNGISLLDDPENEEEINFSISTEDGTLSLGGLNGITFQEGDGLEDSSIQLKGSLQSINLALEGMIFKPTHDFSGDAVISLTANDLGHTGQGEAASTESSLVIEVVAQNDAPTIVAPTELSIQEDIALSLTVTNNNAITIHDDAAVNDGTIQVRFSAEHGSIALKNTEGLSFPEGDSQGDKQLLIQGKYSILSESLKDITYTSDLNYNGGDAIKISVNDMGNHGLGGEKTANHEIALTIQPQNDPPHEIRLSSNIAEEGKSGFVIGTVTAQDIDEGDSHTFKLLSGARDFSLNGATLRTVSALSFLKKPIYSIIIETTDKNGATFKQTFTIRVKNANDPPTGITLSNEIIAENLPENTIVGKLNTLDLDGTLGRGLIGYWPFDEAFGTTTADETNQHNTASLHKMGDSPWATGKYSSALSFNGFGHVEIPHIETYEIDAGTVSLWYQHTSSTGTLFSKDANGKVTGGHFYLRLRNNLLESRLQSVSQDYNIQATTEANNAAFKWHHVALLFGPEGHNLHLDGKMVATNLEYQGGIGTSSGGLGNEEPIAIGANTAKSQTLSTQPTTEYYKGLIDDVRLYNRELETEELQELATAQFPSFDSHTYELLTTTESKFYIDGNTLRLAEPLDFEKEPEHTIKVQTTDSGGLSHAQSLTISVLDVNDAPSGLELSGSEVFENLAAGTSVGTFSAIDEDVATDTTIKINQWAFSYLEDEGKSSDYYPENVRDFSGAVFQKYIPDIAYLVHSLQNPDENIGNGYYVFETWIESSSSTVIPISIWGADGHSLFLDDELLIGGGFGERENGSIALEASKPRKLTAVGYNGRGTVFLHLTSDLRKLTDTRGISTSTGGNRHIYKLVDGLGGKDNALYKIVDGQLVTNAPFNFEETPTHSIRVQVNDAGMTFEKSFTITIKDANDAPSGISPESFSVSENANKGDVVGDLKAIDVDKEDTHTFVLITPADDAPSPLFTIVKNQVIVNGVLDFETQPSHSLKVTVYDTDISSSHTQTIVVNVTNENEAPTAITLEPAFVKENQNANTIIGTLSAVDPDGEDSSFSFNLANKDDLRNFYIEGNQLRITRPLDFEEQSVHLLAIQVKDQGGLFITKEIQVTLKDLNEPPTDIQLLNNVIKENMPEGTAVGEILTIDPDKPAAGTTNRHQLQLVDGDGASDNELFAIEGNLLSTTAPLDFEGRSEYSIRVKSTDSGGLSFSKSLIIHTTDAPDAPTGITMDSHSILENEKIGSLVGTFSATDPDEIDKFIYELNSSDGDGNTPANDNEFFVVSKGQLKTAATFDFETQKTYSISVKVTDSAQLSYTQDLEITILDINEAPEGLTLIPGSIIENEPPNTSAGIILAIDPDLGDSHTFRIIGGVNQDDFIIEENQLLSQKVFDYETQAELEIILEVQDKAGLITEQKLIIEVVDASDPPTDILLDITTYPENQAIGTPLATLTAVDTDEPPADSNEPPFSYTLVSGDGDLQNSLYSIEGDKLLVAEIHNFEEHPQHSIRIKVTDSGGFTFEKSFELTLTDAPDQPSDILLSPNTVAENEQAGSLIGVLEALDEDASEKHTFSLSSDEQNFTLRKNTLSTNTSFDFEAQSTYSVVVNVTDKHSLTFTKEIEVKITDANDAPVGLSIDQDVIAEGLPSKTEVGTLTAIDPDVEDIHRFSIIGGEPTGMFFISGDKLMTSRVLDREMTPEITVRIRTLDSGKANFDHTLTITVADVNDAPTNILLDNTTVEENLPQGSLVGNLSLIDPDLTSPDPTDNFEPIFELVEGPGSNDNSRFLIEGTELQILTPLNFEERQRYRIRIKAEDSGGLSVEKVFQINITDVSEAPKEILISSNFLAENMPKSTQIGTLYAIDDDYKDQHFFGLANVDTDGPNDTKFFFVKNNILYSKAIMDYDVAKERIVYILARDLAKNTLIQPLTIQITDANDPPISINIDNNIIPENHPRGTFVGNLSVEDPDVNDRHKFIVVGGVHQDSFYTKGDKLYTYRPFDFETEKSLQVVVRAIDSGKEFVDSTLTIQVTDFADAPVGIVIDNDTIPEGAPLGSKVGILSLVDPDVPVIVAEPEPEEPQHLLATEVKGSDADQRFGHATAVSGNIFAVGAYGEQEDNLVNSGAVYLYQISEDGTISEPVRISPEKPQKNEKFGWDLSLHNNTLLVGAPGQDAQNKDAAGAVYVYEIDPDSLQATLKSIYSEPLTTEEDAFGFSVKQLGNLVVVGAPDSNTNEIKYSGAAYAYTLSQNHELVFQQKLTSPVPSRGESYGMDIALSPTKIVISANRASPQRVTAAGAVHIYGYNLEGEIVHEHELVSPDINKGDSFGNALALKDNRLFVGTHFYASGGVEDAGAVFVFEINRDSVSLVDQIERKNPRKNDYFGENLAVFEDLLLVSSKYAEDGDIEDVGSVDVYRIESTGKARFLMEYKLPEPTPGSFLGSSISMDSEYLVIGAKDTTSGTAKNAGAVYIKPLLGPDPFSLVAGYGDFDNEYFSIVWNQLKVIKPLNFEERQEYSIRVRGVDETELSVEQQMIIRTTDSPEAPTQIFIDNSTIPENAKFGTSIGILSVEDEDQIDKHTYQLVDSSQSTPDASDNQYFQLKKNLLRSGAIFDFEAKSEYTVFIKVTDSAGLSYVQQFLITVTNQNDPPSELSIDNDSVAENQLKNTPIGYLSATDPDPKERLFFQIVGGKDRNAVALKKNLLRTNDIFDYETKSELDVVIRVTDSSQFYKDFPLTIHILDVNDAPTDLTIDNLIVEENQGADALVGKLTPKDVDNDFVTGDRFSLVREKKIHWEAAKAHAEEQGGYLATFTSKQEWDTMTSLIGIENLENLKLWIGGTDEKVEGKWEWITGEPWVWAWWNENQPSQTDIQDPRTGEWNRENYLHIHGNVSPELKWNDSTHDQLLNGYILENEVFIFNLVQGVGDDHNHKFYISQNELRFKNNPDFEEEDVYSVRIEVTDPFGATYQKPFFIYVTDSNEPPYPPVLSNNTIAENQPLFEPVGRLTVEDPDIRDFAFPRLAEDTTDNDNELFIIKKNVIYSNASFDHEDDEIKTLKILTKDKGGNEIETVFEIQVTDVNEPPVDLQLSEDTIPEDADSPISVISAIDPDVKDTFFYSLVPGEGDVDNASFTLDSATGELSVASTAILDYETKFEMTIRVRVEDSADHTIEKILLLNISDVNDPPIAIRIDNQSIMEGMPKGSHVGNLIADDSDANDSHNFTLVSGEGDTHNDFFTIKSDRLITQKVLSRQAFSSASIRVKVVDQEGLAQEDILTIHVTDAPDAPESILLDANTLEKFQPTGTYIGTFSSNDIDVGDTHSFELTAPNKENSNQHFYILGDQLLSNHVFDETAESAYTINVQVTDSSGLSLTADLTIDILDAQQPTGYFVSISRTPPEGGLVSGAGYYEKGAVAEIMAQGSPGYQFVGHSGDIPGGFSADNPLLLTVESDIEIKTNFSPGFFQVNVGVHPPQHGYAWGGGNIVEGTEITVHAQELDKSYGAKLTHWTINNEIIPLNQAAPGKLNVKVDRTMTILAHFDYGLHESMTHIPSGTFTQGNDKYKIGPTTQPYINALYLDKYETTKKLWYEIYNWAIRNGYDFDVAPNTIKGRNMAHKDPAYLDDYPITAITWLDALKWCNARSEKEGLTPVYYADEAHTEIFRSGGTQIGFEPTNAMVKWNAKGYRLPTEAEWEKAARGGVAGLLYPNGNIIDSTNIHYNQKTVIRSLLEVGSPRPPNGYGLYDISGNAWEMCWDWYSNTYYKENFDKINKDPNYIHANPRGPDLEEMLKHKRRTRIARGGSGNSNRYQTRVFYRKDFNITWMQYAITLRSAVPAPNEPYVDLTSTAYPAHLGSAIGGGTYPVGTQVTLQALPIPQNAEFIRWEDQDGNLLGNNSKLTLKVSEDVEAKAIFKDLTPASDQLYTLQLAASPSDSGKVLGGGAFLKGSVVTIQAIPTGDNDFAGWSGDESSLQDTIEVTLNSHKTIIGYFGDTSVDSDKDGLSDLYENSIGSNPYVKDSDGDTLLDSDELNIYSSNPALTDSDGDGFDDKTEFYYKTKLNDPTDFPFIPEDRLVRYFTFRGKPYDYSRNRIAATGSNFSLAHDRNRDAKSAYYFESKKSAFLTISKFTGISGANARTLSGWLKADEIEDGGILGWGNTGGIFEINVSSGVLQLLVNDTTLTGTTIIQDGDWHQFIVTLPDEGTLQDLKIWINGVLETMTIDGDVTASVNSITKAEATIAKTSVGFFTGGLDEIRIWERVLVESEAKQLYALEQYKEPDYYRPIIEQVPTHVTVAEGDSALFEVVAYGKPEPTYRWQRLNVRIWEDVRGQNRSIYSIPYAQLEDNTRIRVIVANPHGTLTTKPVLLTVLEKPRFKTQPQDIQFLNVGGGQILLDVAGSPKLMFEWFKGEESQGVFYSNKFRFPKNANQKTHGGTYKIKVSNDIGEATSAEFDISFIEPVTITQHPQDTGIVVQSSGFLSVTAEGGGSLTYQWRKYDTKQRQWVDIPGGNLPQLSFDNMRQWDEGAYLCAVSNGPSTLYSAAANVVMYIPPTIRTQPRSTQANEYTSPVFVCIAQGTPEPAYQWQKYNQEQGIWEDIPKMVRNELILKKVPRTATGKYRAVVTNAGGSITSQEAELTVYYLPTLTKPLELTIANEDSSTTLSVEVDALDKKGNNVYYTWYFNKKALQDKNGVTGARTGTITIDPVKMEHTGVYQCEIKNALGSTFSDAKLIVIQKPYLAKPVQDITLYEGKSLSLAAAIRGSKPMTFKWQKDGADINGANLLKLVLRDVTPQDTGKYTLVASNPAGEVNVDINLTILSITAASLPVPTLDHGIGESSEIDSDGDGLSNLIEHAMGSDPARKDSAFAPILDTIQAPDGSTHLTYSYTQNKAATNLTYIVEVSADLQNWEPLDLNSVSTSKLDRGQYTEITYYFEQLQDSSFFRVRVEK